MQFTMPPALAAERFAVAADDLDDEPVVLRSRSVWARLWDNTAFRRALILLTLAACWETYGRVLANPLLFPTLSATLTALVDGICDGTLIERTATSLRVLAVGYCVGVAAAIVVTSIAVSTRIGSDLATTLTAMFNPLPSVALLPLALLWFGLGMPSLVFVIIHSVLWPLALNTHAGFLAVPETQRMVGRNIGLRGVSYIAMILVPAAFPSILAGLKIAWAFAWRTLIAAELVFGVASRSGGLGWFIFENRNNLQTENVFAGLLTVIAIGIVVDGVVFRTVEAITIRRWRPAAA